MEKVEYGVCVGGIKKFTNFYLKLFFFIWRGSDWGSRKGGLCHLKYWRRLIFIVQSLANRKKMMEVFDFLNTNSLRCNIVVANPCILEQVVRHWFYYGSTMQERIKILLLLRHSNYALKMVI